MVDNLTKWDDINLNWDMINSTWVNISNIHDEIFDKDFYKWNELDQKWEYVNQKWEDLKVLIEIDENVRGSGGNYLEYFKGNPWNKLKETIGDEKTKKIINLYLNYKNKEYIKSIENKELKINIDIKNIKFSIIDNNIKISASNMEIFIKNTIKEFINVKVNLKK